VIRPGWRCAQPPHETHQTRVTRSGPAARAGRGTARTVRWMAAAPAERATLPGAALLYGTGAALGAAQAPPLGVLPVTAGAAGLAYGAVLHATRDPARARRAAIAAALAGGWLSGAAEWGVLAGPDHLMTLGYLGAAGIGYGVLRRDELLRARRRRRADKAAWHRIAHRFGLAGSHLLAREDTRLGESFLLDVTGTGRRASQLASQDVAERIAEHYRLPAVRVQVTPDRIAGRLRVSIRHQDPWAKPALHPLLDEAPEITLPAAATVRQPLIIGQDPETGRPLTLPVWDEDGAMRVLVVALTGGGKTVLLNCVTERLTAAPDCVVWDINLSKAKETRRWAPACDLTAIGPGERKKALQILRLAHRAIDYRGTASGDEAVFRPGPGRPLIVVKIDELDTLAAAGDPMGQAFRDELGYLQSKGRSEGVAVIAAGQRATISHTGDSDIRTQFDHVALMKTSRRTEMMHAAGDLGLTLPSMAEYGEGHAGVVIITDLAGGTDIGRTFKLSDLADIDRLAASRRPAALEPGLAAHLGDVYASLRAGQPAAATARTAPRSQPSGPGAGGDQGDLLTWLDADLEESLPGDLRAIADRNAQTRRLLEQTASIRLAEIPAAMRQLAARAAAERTAQASAETEIPADRRAVLLTLLDQAAGTTMSEAMATLAAPRMAVWRWLDRLRAEGTAELHGRGRGARWHLAPAAQLAEAEISGQETP